MTLTVRELIGELYKISDQGAPVYIRSDQTTKHESIKSVALGSVKNLETDERYFHVRIHTEIIPDEDE